MLESCSSKLAGPTRAENVSATRGASSSATESLGQTSLIFVAVPRAYSPDWMYISMPPRHSDTPLPPRSPLSIFHLCLFASAGIAAKKLNITQTHNKQLRPRTSRAKMKLPGRTVNPDRH